MGTHLRVLSQSYPMNTNMTGLNGFEKTLLSSALDKVASVLEGLSLTLHNILRRCVDSSK